MSQNSGSSSNGSRSLKAVPCELSKRPEGEKRGGAHLETRSQSAGRPENGREDGGGKETDPPPKRVRERPKPICPNQGPSKHNGGEVALLRGRELPLAGGGRAQEAEDHHLHGVRHPGAARVEEQPYLEPPEPCSGFTFLERPQSYLGAKPIRQTSLQTIRQTILQQHHLCCIGQPGTALHRLFSFAAVRATPTALTSADISCKNERSTYCINGLSHCVLPRRSAPP